MTKKKPEPALISPAVIEELGSELRRIHAAVLNPRPVEVRHVHEAPPKPFGVTVSIESDRGYQSVILCDGGSFDLPMHLTHEPDVRPRRWWHRPAPRPSATPVRIRIVDIR